ncbi:MAG: hypothetical protein LBI64_03485 [Coriobacteriales bacterium]|jgi:hypothetical protein|nr:hypothetical protein [Coriobacteriales bacterium]
MISQTSSEFSTNADWHQAVVGGRDMILRRTSALEFLQLFPGYMREKEIDVYATRPGEFENITYCLVDSFDSIDHVRFGDVLCATPNQTFNEMLANYDNMDETIDEQALIEGLARYYFSHGESFDELEIWPENLARFNEVKDWAIEYHNVR